MYQVAVPTACEQFESAIFIVYDMHILRFQSSLQLMPSITRRPARLIYMRGSVSTVGCMPLLGGVVGQRTVFKAANDRPNELRGISTA
jgi:hypothetical protein